MRYYLMTVLFFSFLGLHAADADSLSLYGRMRSNGTMAESGFFSLVYDNPAMKYVWHPSTLNELRAGGEYIHEEQPSLAEEGDGRYMGFVDVRSFIRKGNSSLWGEARYKNGKKTGRRWNETSDYLLLYPYVMGDTVGGDLKSEQYYFSGGYAYRKGSYTIGAEGSYGADIEYRNADPRPKNLTGDLYFTIGMSWKTGNHYALGYSLHARKYKQTNDLQFYNELGVPNIYHFTGLGTDYYRFRGAKGKSFYKGRSFGGSVNLSPFDAGEGGFAVSLLYDHFSFDKIISSLNELPMASVGEHDLRGEIAWRSSKDRFSRWGMKLEAAFTKRTGTENLFGDASGNIYPQIAEDEMYMNRISRGVLSGFYEYTYRSGTVFSIIPSIGYTDMNTRYVYPRREMEIHRLHSQLMLKAMFPCGHWLLRGELGGRYVASLTPELQLPAVETEEAKKLNQPVYGNYGYLAANQAGFQVAMRGDYSRHKAYGLFLELRYVYGHDTRPSATNSLTASVGVAF